jgi:hypothetical protein
MFPDRPFDVCFTSPKKVNLVVFHFRESEKNLKVTPWMNFRKFSLPRPKKSVNKYRG